MSDFETNLLLVKGRGSAATNDAALWLCSELLLGSI
jgi:hypothetical protein